MIIGGTMAKRKKGLKKKQKILLFSLIGILLMGGLLVTFPKFYQQYKVENKEEEPVKEEAPKLKIIDLNSNSRPIAVMINNIGPAREVQSGLQEAYMVYEIIVEGGLTRLMAVYKDADTARVGSIRSSRHYYLDYALENDAIYVHWGYSEYAQNDISKLKINNVNGLVYGNKYFWKDNTLKVATEHRAFTNMDLIHQGMEKLGYRSTTNEKPLLNYSVEELDLSTIEGAIPANNISITYSRSMTSSYVYDAEAKNYKRSVNGKPHIDHAINEQNTAKNIITYQVKNTTILGDVKGRQNLDNIGSGTGYYISDGYAVPISWSKTSRSAKTIYKLKDGTELKVNDGNTYIQIQPVGGALVIS